MHNREAPHAPYNPRITSGPCKAEKYTHKNQNENENRITESSLQHVVRPCTSCTKRRCRSERRNAKHIRWQEKK